MKKKEKRIRKFKKKNVRWGEGCNYRPAKMRDTDESRWDEMNRWKQHIQSDTVDMERQMRKCHQYLSFEIQNEGGKKGKKQRNRERFFFFESKKNFKKRKRKEKSCRRFRKELRRGSPGRQRQWTMPVSMKEQEGDGKPTIKSKKREKKINRNPQK